MVMKIDNHELTEKQEEVVNYAGEELLIKGIAGSGKTTVLLRKAVKLIEKNPNVKIALFTYNKTLSKYVKQIAEKIGGDNLFVYTFHGWAFGAIKYVQNKRFLTVASGPDQKQYLKQAKALVAKNSKHRFVSDDKYTDFLLEEISWMKGKGIGKKEQYLSVSRSGRGSTVRVTKADRTTVFGLFEAYENARIQSGKIEFDDFASILLKDTRKVKNKYDFDVVMVDEAQDLQQLQLQLLNTITKKTFIVAADKGQKIYKTSFSWKDIGINILGGRTKVLENSFRSTKQIIQLAHSLQMNDSIIHDDEYVAPIYPNYSGPMPDIYSCTSKVKQDAVIVDSIETLRKEHPNWTIGVLSRNWKGVNRLYHSLQAKGIPHEFIKKDQGDTLSSGIKMTTFHSAKGLEFDCVIIMDLVADAPDQELKDEEYLEVERRLLYVSITRAKSYLQIYYYGEPSTFIAEMDSEYYNSQEIK